MQYFLTYNLGWQAPANKKANLGTVTHKTLEVLANMKLILQNTQALRSLKRSYEDKELGKFEFTKKTLESHLRMSSLSLVDEILQRSYDFYVSNTPDIEYTRADFKFCEKMVEACLSHNDGQFDPRQQHIVAPEKSFDLEINEPWARVLYNGEVRQLRIKGTMDLVTSPDPGVIEYVDYKTGARKNWATDEEKTYAKLHDDIQLLLYFYALRKLYPEYKHIIMTIFYLRDGGPFSLCFDDSDETKFLKKLEEKFVEIKNCNYPKPINKWRSGFKCEKLCHYYKTNWPGTDKSMCCHAEDTIKTYGIENAISKLSRPGFTIDFYSAPGAINNVDTNKK
jgi:hypothetical protein